MLVNNQLVCLPPVGIFKHVLFICIICFIIWFHWPWKAPLGEWSIKTFFLLWSTMQPHEHMLNIDYCYCPFFIRHEQPLCSFSVPRGGCHATLHSVAQSTAAACWHFPPQTTAGNATATSLPELPTPVTSTSTTAAAWIAGIDNKDSICFPNAMLQDSLKVNTVAYI